MVCQTNNNNNATVGPLDVSGFQFEIFNDDVEMSLDELIVDNVQRNADDEVNLEDDSDDDSDDSDDEDELMNLLDLVMDDDVNNEISEMTDDEYDIWLLEALDAISHPDLYRNTRTWSIRRLIQNMDDRNNNREGWSLLRINPMESRTTRNDWYDFSMSTPRIRSQ